MRDLPGTPLIIVNPQAHRAPSTPRTADPGVLAERVRRLLDRTDGQHGRAMRALEEYVAVE